MVIAHLHKLIRFFSIEFIRMELRLQYVSIMMHCELSFTVPEKMFELNLFNVAIATTGRLGLGLFLEK